MDVLLALRVDLRRLPHVVALLSHGSLAVPPVGRRLLELLAEHERHLHGLERRGRDDFPLAAVLLSDDHDGRGDRGRLTEQKADAQLVEEGLVVLALAARVFALELDHVEVVC